MSDEPVGLAGPGEAPSPPPSPSHRARSLLAIAIVVSVILVAVVGYSVAGFAYASSHIASADATLSKVADHQSSLASTFNELGIRLSTATITGTTTDAELQRDKGLFTQLVTDSQAAVPTIDADDASLARAQAALRERAWLTEFSRTRLDQEATRIGHARKALADARTIAVDYGLLGQFYQAFFDTKIDWDALTAKVTNSDLAGAASVDATLQTDLARALQLSNAPGLPAEAHQYEVDFQTLAIDVGKFVADLRARNTKAASALSKTVEADATRVDGHDWTKIDAQIATFYQPLIDDYNAESRKAAA